jgi:hypothetical protein
MIRLLSVGLVLILVPHAIAAQAPANKVPPFPRLVIVQPETEQPASGNVEVRVKTEVPDGASLPTVMYAGLGGAPWTQLKRNADTGEWAAQLDSTLVPNGTQKLIVVTDNKRANISVDLTVANPLQIFFGDLHSHTSYSDGTLLPVIAHDYAKNESKLDVFCLTDHLEAVSDDEWLDMREVAFDANEDGKFVAIPGLEWTKKWGHLNIYDPNTRVWPDDPTEFYKAAADAGVVLKFNHPGEGTVTHDGLAYSEVGDKAVELMEVRFDQEEKAFIRALNNGWHLAPEGSDDTHSPNWGNVTMWTGILAPGLSKRNVLDALKNRRVYSTGDRNCQLGFDVNGAVMGSIVDQPCQTVQLAVTVTDPDETDVAAKIEIFEDGVVVHSDAPNLASRKWEAACSPKPGKHYYFAKVTQADGNVLWSAPVWVTVSAP